MGRVLFMEDDMKEAELRDHIAMHAMAAIIAKHPPRTQMASDEMPQEYALVAAGAYLYADAMIKAR